MKTFKDLSLNMPVYLVLESGSIRECVITYIGNENAIREGSSNEWKYEAKSGAGYYADKSRALFEAHKLKLIKIKSLDNQIAGLTIVRNNLINETK